MSGDIAEAQLAGFSASPFYAIGLMERPAFGKLQVSLAEVAELIKAEIDDIALEIVNSPTVEDFRKPGTQGCRGESLALTEQVRCIARKRLDPKRVTRLESVALASVEAGVKYVLGLP